MAASRRKPGRPIDDPYASISDRYTTAELYDLWKLFRGEPDEIQRLEAFSLMDRNETIELSQLFWTRWMRDNAQNAL